MLPVPVPPRISEFTFTKCCWLCLPALILGAWVRISYLAALPEAMYTGDSNSYFETAVAAWLDGELEVSPKRRWLYPLLLIVAPALPGNSLQVVAVVQHVVGLAVILAAGWITGHAT